MDFPTIDEATRIQRLVPPTGKIDMVLDTDTFNEIDDQFAVAYSLLSPESMNVEAIYAAPFSHGARGIGPAEGMQLSYDEILRLLDRLDRSPEGFVFKGSTSYLPAADEPVVSPAAEDIVAKAMTDRDGPLYVLAIGAITDVASAILIEPAIIERIVVVWLGGNAGEWPTAAEYNLSQDVPAARVVFDCGVPFVHIPCHPVAVHLRTTVPEMERWVKGQSPIADYLYQIFCDHHDDHFAWSKVIWDIATIAWLINSDWVPSVLDHSPILTDQATWSRDRSRHFIRQATNCNRDEIFRDLFTKLANV